MTKKNTVRCKEFKNAFLQNGQLAHICLLEGPPVPCGEAPSLPGSSITYKNPLRSHGSMASYTCNTGYTGNSEAIVCQSGKWTDPVNPVICTIG